MTFDEAVKNFFGHQFDGSDLEVIQPRRVEVYANPRIKKAGEILEIFKQDDVFAFRAGVIAGIGIQRELAKGDFEELPHLAPTPSKKELVPHTGKGLVCENGRKPWHMNPISQEKRNELSDRYSFFEGYRIQCAACDLPKDAEVVEQGPDYRVVRVKRVDANL